MAKASSHTWMDSSFLKATSNRANQLRAHSLFTIQIRKRSNLQFSLKTIQQKMPLSTMLISKDMNGKSTMRYPNHTFMLENGLLESIMARELLAGVMALLIEDNIKKVKNTDLADLPMLLRSTTKEALRMENSRVKEHYMMLKGRYCIRETGTQEFISHKSQ